MATPTGTTSEIGCVDQDINLADGKIGIVALGKDIKGKEIVMV